MRTVHSLWRESRSKIDLKLEIARAALVHLCNNQYMVHGCQDTMVSMVTRIPVRPRDYGTCPHCSENLRFEAGLFSLLGALKGGGQMASDAGKCEVHGAKKIINIAVAACPSCGEPIISIVPTEGDPRSWLAYPLSPLRAIPKEVLDEDPKVAEDYREASMLVNLSPKASAALSRRCLETILNNKAKVDPNTIISRKIQLVLDSKTLPTYLHESLDAIRNYGTFGAHPLVSKVTGAIVDVESGEAEYSLDILDDLFDFYYVKPAQAKAKRMALNTKLKEAGKTPMKQ